MERSPVSEKRWQGTEKNFELDSSRKIKITNFQLWQFIVIRKYMVEWVTTGVIQITETIQIIIYREPVCLQSAETSHL